MVLVCCCSSMYYNKDPGTILNPARASRLAVFFFSIINFQEYLIAGPEDKEAFHSKGIRRLTEDNVLMPSGRVLASSSKVTNSPVL